MFIQKNSILFYLPKNLKIEDLLILDSIRFSIELIDFNYQLFINEIKHIINNHVNTSWRNEKNIVPCFNYCWSIIDNFQRFIKLYQLLPSNNNHALIEELLYVNSLRNTFQHLDERIKECLLENEMPFYGVISWEINLGIENQMSKFYLISGLFIEHEKFVMKVQKNTHPINEILNISLQTLVNEGNRKNKSFQKIEFNLSDYILKAKSMIKKLELDLENQFVKQGATNVNWSKRRDIILKIDC